MKKTNLLLLGASGGVANAFLCNLTNYRNFFGNLILVSKHDDFVKSPYLDHKQLAYKYLKDRICLPQDEKKYFKILKKYKINVVLDLTDADTIPLLEATNKAGVSYLNTSLNSENKTVADLIFYIYPRKKIIKNGTHILCAGMNPGIVNMWVRYGIEKFGIPEEVVHFEYDTSQMVKNKCSMVTWSRREFIVESIRDPSGIMVGRNKLKKIWPNALVHRIKMRNILSPIMKLEKYPEGFLVLHEENLTIAQKYDIPSKFIYAINQDTAKSLEKLYKNKKEVKINNIKFGDNVHNLLEGSDNIGVVLNYKDKKVYYFNSINNSSVMGKNATYAQVAIGVFSALFTLMFGKLRKGIYFVEDLYNTHYKNFMFDNMVVKEFVFKKQKDKLKLLSYNPCVKF